MHPLAHPTRPLLTVGHGTLSAAELRALLQAVGVRRLVDVRRYPGSRRLPHFRREEMQRWLPAAGIDYRYAPDLGGRRAPGPDSPHVALRNEGFRGYAEHMQSLGFDAALRSVLRDAASTPTAVVCAESVWWRCHRRLLADAALLLHGIDVAHVMHDGRLQPHQPTAGVRRDGDRLVYDLLSRQDPAGQLPGFDGG